MKSPPFRYPYDTVAGAASSMDRPPKKWRNGPNHGKIKKSGGPCARIAERQTMTTTPKHPHNGHRARLRQRARETGLAGLADHEVLELLLTYAIPRVDTNRTAHRLIHTFGSLSGVLEARYEDLRQVEGVGENAATLLTLFPSLTRRYLLSRTGEKPLLNTSERAGEYGRALFADCRVETLYLLCLDVKCRLLQAVKLAEGTIDRVPVQNREIIRAVLSTQAKNVLMMHNHPSGSLRPTAEDIDLARRVMHALESIEVLLVDHLIIGADGYFSFMNNQIGDTGAKPRPALMYAAEDEF